MMNLLEEFKAYCRIDGTHEDATLNLFIHSARQTLENSGVVFPDDLYEADENGVELYTLHRLAIFVLATHYYENRQAVSSAAQNVVPMSVQNMILQLKIREKVEEDV